MTNEYKADLTAALTSLDVEKMRLFLRKYNKPDTLSDDDIKIVMYKLILDLDGIPQDIKEQARVLLPVYWFLSR